MNCGGWSSVQRGQVDKADKNMTGQPGSEARIHHEVLGPNGAVEEAWIEVGDGNWDLDIWPKQEE